MKNLSEFKKALVVGDNWECFNSSTGKTTVRPVSIVQSNSVAFKSEKGDSWLSYPKAKQCTFINNQDAVPTIRIDFDGEYLLYRKVI